MDGGKNLLPYQVLRQLRWDAGITLRGLSSVMGISEAYLCDIENGKRNLTPKVIAKLPNHLRPPVASAEIERIREIMR